MLAMFTPVFSAKSSVAGSVGSFGGSATFKQALSIAAPMTRNAFFMIPARCWRDVRLRQLWAEYFGPTTARHERTRRVSARLRQSVGPRVGTSLANANERQLNRGRDRLSRRRDREQRVLSR